MVARRCAGRAWRPRFWLGVHPALLLSSSGEGWSRRWFRWKQRLEGDFPPVCFGSAYHGRGWRLEEVAALWRRWLVVAVDAEELSLAGVALARALEMVEAARLMCCMLRRLRSWWSARLSSSGKFGFWDLRLGEIPASRRRGLQRRRLWTPFPPWRRCFCPRSDSLPRA